MSEVECDWPFGKHIEKLKRLKNITIICMFSNISMPNFSDRPLSPPLIASIPIP